MPEASFRATPTTPDHSLPRVSSRASNSREGSRSSQRPDSRGSRRFIGPAGFGRASLSRHDQFDSQPYVLPQTPSTQAVTEDWGGNKDGLDFYLPFKLFRSASTKPQYRHEQLDVIRSQSAMNWQEVKQMDQFVSETAQAMVGFHAQKCAPVQTTGANADIYKMETLSDLMKKHKDAFHREYDEFGPVSEWTPDAVAGKSSVPIPSAARELGKHFDLRGELATITHVRRSQCRLRHSSPLLLNRLNTPYLQGARGKVPPVVKAPKQSSSAGPAVAKPLAESALAMVKEGTHPNPDKRFPPSLQFLYLPPARTGIAVVESSPTRNKPTSKS